MFSVKTKEQVRDVYSTCLLDVPINMKYIHVPINMKYIPQNCSDIERIEKDYKFLFQLFFFFKFL